MMVAHFNHGTRPSAEADQEFVRVLAERYGVPFFTAKSELGPLVSEERARAERYKFLRRVAREQGAEIYTAHHADDLVETVCLNILRGTGWRGLAPFGAKDVRRPFLEPSLMEGASFPVWKKDLLKYAGERGLRFRQDPTNSENQYLRNVIREKLQGKEELKHQIFELARRQQDLREEVEEFLDAFLTPGGIYQRELFRELDENLALEVLRSACERIDIRLTRPQLNDFLCAILTYAPEKQFNLPGGKLITLHKHYFQLG